MPTDNPASSKQEQATALLSQLPLGAIVGGPLKAAVDAQAAAAMACYDFIANVAFEGGGGRTIAAGKAGEPRTGEEAAAGTQLVTADKGKVREITFKFQRRGANNQQHTMSITVPLLTILPIPFIRIESMTINFKASIAAEDTHTQQDTSSTSSELAMSGSAGFAWWKVSASGKVSSKKDSTATNTSKYSVEHTMDINVHAVQEDMPAGLAKILSIMTDSIRMDIAPAAAA